MKKILLSLLLVISIPFIVDAKCVQKEGVDLQLDFEIFTPHNQAVIVYKKEQKLDSVLAFQLAEDIFKVTNYKPKVYTQLKKAKGNVIVIGEIKSPLIQFFIKPGSVPEKFKNQWESYLFKTLVKPTKQIKKAFVIAGTNARGTAYGVFDLSKKIGVSPWYWWADVPVVQQKKLIFQQSDFYSKPPSVKYRGIFLNDEDWGLQPWAANNFEIGTKDIGPKTYSKIFELLLRLNANTIWPAMHPSTKAFFYYPDNVKMANLYQIILGSSHAEPMLRNNVSEWDKNTMGDFNYITNKASVLDYWEKRVKESKNSDAIYTVGMRGIHDSGMKGVKNKEEAAGVLSSIIKDQRTLLKRHLHKNITEIPQALTLYKEVLDIYKNGLELPEDITLVWTDDNYGYIRGLSDDDVKKRTGGGGVYYHISYWGRPHDYLWLSTTNPHLIRSEMMNAYQLNNREIWIVNVGDIKPAEYNIQLFLDMAYAADKFKNSTQVDTHQKEFYSDIFGTEIGAKIANIRTDYFQLAFERKPEFMGWSQTEPTTQINTTQYSTSTNLDEVQKRINAYQTLENQVNTLETKIPVKFKSTFTQLVGYPVKAAANINKKFLFRQKSLAYAKQGRISALGYKKMSDTAYEKIIDLTKDYNQVSNGKWEGIMDMKPRKLPVFDKPEIKITETIANENIGFSIQNTFSKDPLCLPTFYENDSTSYFIDVFLKNKNTAKWCFKNIPKWVKASKVKGSFSYLKDITEDRIKITIDWDLWRKAKKPTVSAIHINLGNSIKPIHIEISKKYNAITKGSIVEKNGVAVVYAESFYKNKKSIYNYWTKTQGLGHTKSVMQATLTAHKALSEIDLKDNAYLSYIINTETVTKNANLALVAIPTHPLTIQGELRIGVQWNNEPVKIVNFKTKGRSAVWKQNVLRNKAIAELKVPVSQKRNQVLKIFMIDPNVQLDYIILDTKSKKEMPYALPSETKI